MPPLIATGVADTTGTATVKMPPLPVPVLIEQIAVSTNGAKGNALVRLNQNFIFGSSQAWSDSADGVPFIPVSVGDILDVLFTLVEAGALCTVTFMGEQ